MSNLGFEKLAKWFEFESQGLNRKPELAGGEDVFEKQINGGLTPGGRVRMERMAALVMNKRFDPGKLVTHTFKGFKHLEDGLELMHHKPADLIKPVILL